MIRRKTCEVHIGKVTIGGSNPVRVQSMTNTDTNDLEAAFAQSQRIAAAGGEIVRLTAQGVREAQSIGELRTMLREAGCDVPLVADIHFNPRAAHAAAAVCDKVRINPGNFVDAARTFKKLTYTDEEYAAETQKIRQALLPFIEICREHGTAVRLGVNHGSLSDRIMSRYGDTPAGMVESVMEFLRVMVAENFLEVVISIKASNVRVMVDTVRLLVEAMDREDMHFPLHLGVTEAGDGEDGRIKSAVGIGTLLAEGLGDTIRVSLSEAPEAEVPVAKKLVQYTNELCNGTPRPFITQLPQLPLLGKQPVVVTMLSREQFAGSEMQPDYFVTEYPCFTVNQIDECLAHEAPLKWVIVNEGDDIVPLQRLANRGDVALLTRFTGECKAAKIQLRINHIVLLKLNLPVAVYCDYSDSDEEMVQVMAGVDLGTAAMNALPQGIGFSAPIAAALTASYSFAILQAARLRTTKTEFISCPGCGRTLFDLQSTVREVKEATKHLTHLKIGIMGCVVNGPGEMADADYGYVGAAAGKISLYKGKECIERNIPQSEAIPRLIALIKQNGDWKDK